MPHYDFCPVVAAAADSLGVALHGSLPRYVVYPDARPSAIARYNHTSTDSYSWDQVSAKSALLFLRGLPDGLLVQSVPSHSFRIDWSEMVRPDLDDTS